MNSGGLLAAGWLAVVCGALLALWGLFLIAAMFTRGSVPIGGAGLFVILTLGLGPVLAIAGIAAAVAAFRLMGGHESARMTLLALSAIGLCAGGAWAAYGLTHVRHIHGDHVMQAALTFLLTGGPAAVLLFLLRSDGVRQAMTK